MNFSKWILAWISEWISELKGIFSWNRSNIYFVKVEKFEIYMQLLDFHYCAKKNHVNYRLFNKLTTKTIPTHFTQQSLQRSTKTRIFFFCLKNSLIFFLFLFHFSSFSFNIAVDFFFVLLFFFIHQKETAPFCIAKAQAKWRRVQRFPLIVFWEKYF